MGCPWYVYDSAKRKPLEHPAHELCHTSLPSKRPQSTRKSSFDSIRQQHNADMICEIGGTPQKGITSYAMSANRQKPMAGVAHAAVFNVARRTRGQILYFAPPFIAVYFLLQWAEERYVRGPE